MPATHARQTDAPIVRPLYAPTAQAVQPVVPDVRLLYVPAAHAVHAAGAPKRPAAHAGAVDVGVAEKLTGQVACADVVLLPVDVWVRVAEIEPLPVKVAAFVAEPVLLTVVLRDAVADHDGLNAVAVGVAERETVEDLDPGADRLLVAV